VDAARSSRWCSPLKQSVKNRNQKRDDAGQIGLFACPSVRRAVSRSHFLKGYIIEMYIGLNDIKQRREKRRDRCACTWRPVAASRPHNSTAAAKRPSQSSTPSRNDPIRHMALNHVSQISPSTQIKAV